MRLAENPPPTQPEDPPVVETPPESPFKSTRFGDYELLGQIGRGGMGVVYEARQVSLNRVVALKMILGGQAASSSAVRRFRAEAEAAAKLSHPNIVAVHEFGEDDGVPYFSMQRIEGTGLDRKKEAFTAPTPDRISVRGNAATTASRPALLRIARLVATLARALHHAHQQGIVHCDLKPSNVLIHSNGEPFLTDFGIAHVLGNEGVLTSSRVIGTPRYMSPEQASGQRRELTAASDIYSLGVILYELLTGQPLFSASTPHEMLRLIAEREPSAPHHLNPTVDRDLSIVCLRCLEKEARHRYASAAELADDLDRWIRHEPVRARRVGPGGRLARWCRRNPALAALAASVAVLLSTVAVGSALFAWNIAQKEKEREAAIALVHAELDNELDKVAGGPNKHVRFTAQRRWILTGKKLRSHGEFIRINFGVYTFDKPSVMAQKFAPLLSRLEDIMADRLSRPVGIDCLIYRSYADGHEGLLAGEVDFMRVGPASYVALKNQRPGISLLAAETDLIQCVIFTRVDSPIESLEQLRGKAFAFGDPDSTFGSHLAKAVLAGAGLRKGDLHRSSRHFGGHREVADAVAPPDSPYAAGAANTVAIPWQFKELHRFTNVLRMPFVARERLDPQAFAAVKEALVAQGNYDEVSDRDYDALRQELKLAEKFGDL